MANAKFSGVGAPQREFEKLIRENARRYRVHEVFRDFCEMAALAFSNSVDWQQRGAREARYLEIVGRYEREEVDRFGQMLSQVVLCLEEGHRDVLGELFMQMGLGDQWKGQFFTPYALAYLMAEMSMQDAAQVIEEKGFITLLEPAAGAGCMVIAAAAALRDQGINYQQHLHATAIDIDQTACHMAYIQLTLLHVPAIVVHGNALFPDKEYGHWVTPAHVLGAWDGRLKRGRVQQDREGQSGRPFKGDELAEAMDVQLAGILESRIEQMNLFA